MLMLEPLETLKICRDHARNILRSKRTDFSYFITNTTCTCMHHHTHTHTPRTLTHHTLTYIYTHIHTTEAENKRYENIYWQSCNILRIL